MVSTVPSLQEGCRFASQIQGLTVWRLRVVPVSACILACDGNVLDCNPWSVNFLHTLCSCRSFKEVVLFQHQSVCHTLCASMSPLLVVFLPIKSNAPQVVTFMKQWIQNPLFSDPLTCYRTQTHFLSSFQKLADCPCMFMMAEVIKET